MQFTTTTEIARKGSKIFQEYDSAIVLNNNKNIGMLVGGKLAQALFDTGILEQLKQELLELNYKETVDLVRSYKTGEKTDSINLDDYLIKNAL